MTTFSPLSQSNYQTITSTSPSHQPREATVVDIDQVTATTEPSPYQTENARSPSYQQEKVDTIDTDIFNESNNSGRGYLKFTDLINIKSGALVFSVIARAADFDEKYQYGLFGIYIGLVLSDLRNAPKLLGWA